MDKLVIQGGARLNGQIPVSGAKNSCLPILAATLLTEEKSVIKNVPSLRDMTTMIRILKVLGVKVQQQADMITVEPGKFKNYTAPYELVSTMRASICVLGPLLARQGKACVSFPGGCVIGPRPIDLHLKGIEALNAKISVDKGYIVAHAKKLKGNGVYLGGHFGSSVLATANALMAATLAEGTTIIENAACEPEIVDLTNFLIRMGAKIGGHMTHRIVVEGVKRLRGVEYSVIPDRIETATYMIAAAITKGDIMLRGARSENLVAVIDKLEEAGLSIQSRPDGIRVKFVRRLKPVDITTLPYPGFPTDVQAQMLSLMSVTDGISVITEKIYPDRFIHISELSRMGARIVLEGPSAIIKGVKTLSGAPVMASDLRASAALVLAGLVAKGTTEIHRVYHLDRGYERLEEKLTDVGAKVWREKE